MSFREKSAWASLAVMLVVFVPYFAHMFRLFERDELGVGTVVGQFISAVIFQVILLIVVHIVIAIRSRQEPKDERDLAIESKSFKIGYYVLVSACFAGIPSVLGAVLGIHPESAPRLMTLPFLSQLLLLCFVFAEAAKYITQVFCYRRGS